MGELESDSVECVAKGFDDETAAGNRFARFFDGADRGFFACFRVLVRFFFGAGNPSMREHCNSSMLTSAGDEEETIARGWCVKSGA